MCGISGEIRFDDRPARVAAVGGDDRRLAPRGPDGERHLGVGSGRARPPPSGDHRPVERAAHQPMVDSELGLTIVFNGCIYNHRPAAPGARAPTGYRFFSTSDTEVILKAYHRWGEDFVDHLVGMFALRHRSSATRAVSSSPATGSASSRSTWPTVDGALRFASSLPALVAGGGVDTSIDPVGLHHYLTFHAVVPAPRTILRGRAASCRRPPSSSSSPTAAAASGATGIGRTAARRPARPATRPTSGASRSTTRCASPSSAAWSPTCRSACCCRAGSTRASSSACSPRRASRGCRPSASGSTPSATRRATSSAGPTSVAERFGTDHHRDPRRAHRPGARRAARRRRGHERADGEPRRRRLLPAVARRSREHVKVVQSGQGADEVFAGYHWYQTLVRAVDGRRRRRLRRGVLRPHATTRSRRS